MMLISMTFYTQIKAPNANAKAIVFGAFCLVDGLVQDRKLPLEADQRLDQLLLSID